MPTHDTDAFRSRYRAEISPRYNAWLHGGFVFAYGIAVLAVLITRIDTVTGWEWLAIPAGLLVFNIGEYAVHRGFGHHKTWLGGLFYRRHTGDHHCFFVETKMTFEQARDWRVIFFPAWLIDFAGPGPKQIVVANRTEERARALASRFGADVMRLDAIGEVLARFDVVVSCTAAPLPFVGLGMVERAVKARRHRPMVMVDLAVPRDIEPEVGKLDDVFLYTVDDLAQVVDAGLESRQQAVIEAEEIINQRVDGFLHWMQALDVVPTIRALRQHAESLRLAELERASRMLARGEDPRAVLEALSHGLANKLLHGPTHYLNQSEGEAQVEAGRLVKCMFNLDKGE